MSHDDVTAELADISLFADPAASMSGLEQCVSNLAGFLTPRFPLSIPLVSWPTAEAPKRFRLRKLREGGRHAVIVINGFWSKGQLETNDWEDSLSDRFRRATWYHLDWDACRSPLEYLKDSFLRLRMPIGRTGFDQELLLAWYEAMRNAEHTGELLAQAIRRTPSWRYTLIGHSLGGRVIHYALKGLARNPRRRIENAYLLGAAVGGSAKDDDCWEAAAGAVKGHIFNCHSDQDSILGLLYGGANVGLSRAVGHSPIHLKHERIVNVDCADFIRGHLSHFDWKPRFKDIVQKLD